MSENEIKTTVGATVTKNMKTRIKVVAQEKHWSVGQTLRLFIERYWHEWEKELGIEPEENSSKKGKEPS